MNVLSGNSNELTSFKLYVESDKFSSIDRISFEKRFITRPVIVKKKVGIEFRFSSMNDNLQRVLLPIGFELKKRIGARSKDSNI